MKSASAPVKHALAAAAPVAAVGAVAATGGVAVAAVAVGAALGGLAGLGIWLARDNRRRLAAIQKSLRHLQTAQDGRAGSDEKLRQHLDAQLGTLTSTELPKLMQQATRQSSDRLEKRLAKAGDARAAEFEALLNLYTLLDIRGVFPAAGGYASGGDLRLAYVREILTSQPKLVLECGSGLSTIWAAYALERVGGDGRVVALENGPEYAEATQRALDEHGLAHRAEVRVAPLTDITIDDDKTWRWYDPASIADLHGIGLLLVDGPPASVGPLSRFPAVPLLRTHLSPGATILLDDARRPDEEEVAKLWEKSWPELESSFLEHTRGTAVLRVPG